MVRLARENQPGNLSLRVCSQRLESVLQAFGVILDRQAPFDLSAVAAHLRPGGYYITQQVGERNMACVKAALGPRFLPSATVLRHGRPGADPCQHARVRTAAPVDVLQPPGGSGLGIGGRDGVAGSG